MNLDLLIRSNRVSETAGNQPVNETLINQTGAQQQPANSTQPALHKTIVNKTQ